MYLSCCAWAITAPPEETLADVSSLGFAWVDVRPEFLDHSERKAQLRAASLKLSSIAASFGLPGNAALDSEERASRVRGTAYVDRAAARCASLGGSAVYLVPGPDGSREAVLRYAESLAEAAEMAEKRGVRLCVEHFPGTSLPTAAATLDLLEGVGHPNLGLLFDIGHIQMSGEDVEGVVQRAGDRLFYVHLDDNDGKNDLHWGLLDGVLTGEALRRLLDALAESGYSGAVSLELSPQLDDPYKALQRSREIVLDCGGKYLGDG